MVHCLYDYRGNSSERRKEQDLGGSKERCSWLSGNVGHAGMHYVGYLVCDCLLDDQFFRILM